MNENKTYKEYKNKLDISPIMQKGDSTNAVVYSFDLDTSKFTYELKMNGQQLSLANASEVNIVLYFGGDNPDKCPKANLVGEIEDKLKSIVSFVMPKQYLGFDGQVLGEFDITFKNGQSLTAGYFSFVMKPSYINGNIEIEQQVYVEQFEDLKNLIGKQSEDINKILIDMQEDIKESNAKVDELNAQIKDRDLVTKPELAVVENKKADKTAVNDISLHLLDKADKTDVNAVKSEMNNKADKVAVDAKISELTTDISNTQIGLLGEFNSESELKAKYPNGEKGYAVVFEDSVGYTYTYKENAWVKGNVWNGMAIADESVTSLKRTTLGEMATISTNGTINIDTTNKTLTVKNGVGNIIYRNKYFPENLQNKEIVIGDTDSSFVYVDSKTGEIKFTGITSIPENSLFLGYCHWNKKAFHFNFPFTVDGYEYRVGKREEAGSLSFIVSNEPLILDYAKKTLTFPNNTSLGLNTFNVTKALPNARGQVLDLNINGGGQGYVLFNESTGKFEFKVLSSSVENEKNVINLGYIFCSSKTKYLNAQVEVVGEITTPTVEKRWTGKKITCLGDSITWGDIDGAGNGGFDYSWTSHMTELCGFKTVENLGIKGTRITSTNSGGSFVERCVPIKDADVIVIFGGINDFNNNMVLGTFLSTDVNTFYGALNIMYFKTITNNPNAKMLAITPMKESKFFGTYGSDFELAKNDEGHTQLDYVEAIRKTADYFSIPVLDLYEQAPFTPYVQPQRAIYMPDGLHPSEKGYKELAYVISEKVNRL